MSTLNQAIIDFFGYGWDPKERGHCDHCHDEIVSLMVDYGTPEEWSYCEKCFKKYKKIFISKQDQVQIDLSTPEYYRKNRKD